MYYPYPYLKAQMAVRGYNTASLAQALNMNYHTLLRKIRGENEFTLSECLRIKARLRYPDTIERLFRALDEESAP